MFLNIFIGIIILVISLLFITLITILSLSKIDKIVLRHSHNDHAGGLRQILFKMRKEVEIIAHPDIWSAKYYHWNEQGDKYAGIPFQRQELESLGANFNLTAKPVSITDSIMTTGEIPMVTDYEDIDPNLLVKGSTGFQPDKVLDDLSLIINHELGLIVITGCAHRGIINTLYHAQQLTGAKVIHTVLGGSHLMSASDQQIRMTIAALRELEVQKLGLCHCTGLPVATIIAQEFGNKFFFNNAGNSINFV